MEWTLIVMGIIVVGILVIIFFSGTTPRCPRCKERMNAEDYQTIAACVTFHYCSKCGFDELQH